MAPRRPGPLRILWAARWELDKDPESFFAALEIARSRRGGVSVERAPASVSSRCRRSSLRRASRSATSIDHWGYLPSREDYVAALLDADVIVSTARHEFFGVGVVEAVARRMLSSGAAAPRVSGDPG